MRDVDAPVTTRADGGPARGSPGELPRPGSRVGRYLVIDELGRGGMGVVLRAYDPKLQREVALKCLRGAESAETTARMVREARAMAKLSHPNVVPVYDVDLQATDGVLIVMEYVAGLDLRQWSTAARRPWPVVVRAFISAGRGLSAAHQAELLHRDFKPANVIVEARDVPTVVKVTDFGLARWAAGDPSRQSADGSLVEAVDWELTIAGSVMGTPAYMAPEQHARESLDARADQFSFCVALWEVLSGQRPYVGDVQTLALAKSEGPPAWPRDVAVPRAVIAAIARGLAPRPEARWPSMTALLDALETATRRPSMRRRAGLAFIGVAAAALIAFEVNGRNDELCTGAEEELGRAWNDERARAAEAAFHALDRSFAAQAWQRVHASLDDYGARWAAMHRETCEATRVRGLQSVTVMDMRMACLRRARIELAAVTEVLAAADPDVVQRADALTASLPDLAGCEDLDVLGAEVEPPSAELAPAVDEIAARVAQARTGRLASRTEAVAAAIDDAVRAARDLGYAPILAEALQEHGRILDLQQRRDDAIESHTEALRLAVAHGQWDVAASAAVSLIFVHGEQNRPDAARAYAEIAASLAPRSQTPLEVEGSIANSLAAMHYAAGEFDAAEQAFTRAIDAYDEAKSSERVADVRRNLGHALYAQGRYEASLEQYRMSLTLTAARLGPDHPDVADGQGSVGEALMRLDRTDEALAMIRKAIAINEAALGPKHARTVMHRIHHALGLVFADRRAEAATELEALLEERRAELGEDHREVVTIEANLGTVLRDLGRLDDAATHLRAALGSWTRTLGPQHVRVASLSTNLAQVLNDQQRYDEAIELLESALPIQRAGAVPPRSKGATAFELARALWESGRDRTRADTLHDEAIASFVEAGTAGEDDLEGARKWRADHPR